MGVHSCGTCGFRFLPPAIERVEASLVGDKLVLDVDQFEG